MLEGRGVRSLFAGALKSSALRRCQLGIAVWRGVDLALLVVLSAWAFAERGAGGIAALAAVRTLAPAVGVPSVTAFSARVSPGAMLAAAAGAGGLAVAGTAAAIAADWPVAVVLAGAGVSAVLVGAFRPLIVAVQPTLVRDPDELAATNALAGVIEGATSLVGPVAGGVLVQAMDAPGALLVIAAVLVVAALPLAGLRARPDIEAGATRLTDGFRVLLGDRRITLVASLCVSQVLVRGALNVLVVVLAVDALGLDESGIGVLLGAMGIGGLLAFPMLLGSGLRRRLGTALGWGLVLWGAPVAVAGLAPNAVAAVAALAVVGVGNALVDLGFYGLHQRLVPPERLASALGATETTLQLGMAVGGIAAAAAIGPLGERGAMVVAGLLLPAVALAARRGLGRLDRELEERDMDVERLRGVAPFGPVVMSAIDRAAAGLVPTEFAPGDVIIAEGEIGDRYLVVSEGEVEVFKDGQSIRVLGPGAGLGEIALVRNVPRTATVIARTRVVALALDRRTFAASAAQEVEKRYDR